MATVMTAMRTKVKVDATWMQENGRLLNFTQACDGVWVPICDLAQYEAGKRPWADS